MEKINPEILEILERIKSYESRGFFDTDVENDPPSKVLEADEIDYLRKKLSRNESGKIHEINIWKIKLCLLIFHIAKLFSTINITFYYILANIPA